MKPKGYIRNEKRRQHRRCEMTFESYQLLNIRKRIWSDIAEGEIDIRSPFYEDILAWTASRLGASSVNLSNLLQSGNDSLNINKTAADLILQASGKRYVWVFLTREIWSYEATLSSLALCALTKDYSCDDEQLADHEEFVHELGQSYLAALSRVVID
jgi:hypothetical protein